MHSPLFSLLQVAQHRPLDLSAETPSTATGVPFDYSAIEAGTSELTTMAHNLGMIGTLAAEACLQRDSIKLSKLEARAADLLDRAKFVPDGGSVNMVNARTSAQAALMKAQEGLQTCDPGTWMEMTTSLQTAGVALAAVSAKVTP